MLALYNDTGQPMDTNLETFVKTILPLEGVCIEAHV